VSPYYEKDDVTIYCGDNCDVLGTFPRECIDLVVTSPPYDSLRTYGGHSWDFYGVAWQLKRVLKPGGVIVWVVDDQTLAGSETGASADQAKHFRSLGLLQHDTMIWRKTNGAPGDGKYRYHPSFEFMFVFAKGKPKATNIIRDVPNPNHGRVDSKTSDRRRDQTTTRWDRTPWVNQEFGFRRNVWDVVHGGSPDDVVALNHPAIFPEALARDHILSWSNEGDVVLDPFNGSGTTTKMSRELGRKAIGIDINEDYCDIAVKRLAQRLLPLEDSGT
jgi:DNA modification methylase